jgi:hypothetical protein
MSMSMSMCMCGRVWPCVAVCGTHLLPLVHHLLLDVGHVLEADLLALVLGRAAREVEEGQAALAHLAQ